MIISSVTSGSSAILSMSNNDNTIAQLEKEKEDLEAQLQKEQTGQDDTKTKQEKIQQLQNQINQIELRINQKKAAQENAATNSKKPQVPPGKATSANNNHQSGKTAADGSDSTLQNSTTQIDIKL